VERAFPSPPFECVVDQVYPHCVPLNPWEQDLPLPTPPFSFPSQCCLTKVNSFVFSKLTFSMKKKEPQKKTKKKPTSLSLICASSLVLLGSQDLCPFHLLRVADLPPWSLRAPPPRCDMSLHIFIADLSCRLCFNRGIVESVSLGYYIHSRLSGNL
jgi:hypothetical protein